MKLFTEKERQIPVRADVDVLVVGAGPAGFAAAISAARCGATTMLIEQTGAVGGIATVGLMSHWTGGTKGPLYEELIQKSNDFDAYDGAKAQGTWRYSINPEALKTVMLEMLLEAKVQLQFYTFASDAIVEEDTVKGIIIESKSGREAIFAGVVIDCTGDGDIAAKAGVPFQKGREEDGLMQPMTLMFKVGGVDFSRAILPGSFETTAEVPNGEIQALGRQSISHPAGHVLLYKSTLPGIVTCNMTNCIGVDGTKAEDLTKAELVCRSQMQSIMKFLHENAPGFEDCFVISAASLMGVRETRHFVGEYTLTAEDIEAARVFDDWVVTQAHFNFDIHSLSGPGLDEQGVQHHFTQPKGYTIPYGCFVPNRKAGIDGLLFAGRNISGTHKAHSNYRVMPICVNMGQAIGTAAALCVSHNVRPIDLDVKALQKELTRQGVTV